ncbi:MAG TPA: hypothetical protein VLA31_06175 [Burkholderiaceae bacterium]|jgi:hypothetical protein|nr:hypothetical protein [Burkholderiaceae bacterium]
MRVENEEVYTRSPKEPIMVRVGGAEMNGQKVVRVTTTILPRQGQTTHDIDLATASMIHAQELFAALDRLTDLTSEGDPEMVDALEEAAELINDIRRYW